ncbi:MAG: ABC transporter permease [Rhodobacterales bacterium]|nr:ABC transporter permease [Rhodobacterales bacterium]
MKSALPVVSVVAVIIALWYAGSVWLNSPWVYDQAARAGQQVSLPDVLVATMQQDRPVLPAPHQVIKGLYDGITGQAITSKRSLVYHAWVTLSGTMFGFVIGTLMGIALAVGIVHNKAMDLSVMPWAIASQMIPIIAIAPMLAVVMNSLGAQPIVTKAIISAYLSFFPVVVGMVKGLRSPDQMQLDLLRTYNAGQGTTFWALRLPASVPYLFTSLKVGIAAALVGAIVGELNQAAGIGARLLSGSYYGQTVQIWAALFMAATMAAVLVMAIGRLEGVTLRRMGMAR